MSLHNRYLDREFNVIDPDARIRRDDNLLAFARYQAQDTLPSGTSVGDFKLIAKDTFVRVSDIKILPSGSKSKKVFVLARSLDKSVTFGWTSSVNFADKFRNEPLGLIEPETGAGQYSNTAAWKQGAYIGQRRLILILDFALQIEKIEYSLAAIFLDMQAAAAAEGVALHINSGFRTYGEQKALYEAYKKGVAGANLAAKPGTSNHQNGIALDIQVSGGAGSPQYDWLAERATTFGFVRTVRSEPWHWEYRPTEAQQAIERQDHRNWT